MNYHAQNERPSEAVLRRATQALQRPSCVCSSSSIFDSIFVMGHQFSWMVPVLMSLSTRIDGNDYMALLCSSSNRCKIGLDMSDLKNLY